MTLVGLTPIRLVALVIRVESSIVYFKRFGWLCEKIAKFLVVVF